MKIRNKDLTSEPDEMIGPYLRVEYIFNVHSYLVHVATLSSHQRIFRFLSLANLRSIFPSLFKSVFLIFFRESTILERTHVSPFFSS